MTGRGPARRSAFGRLAMIRAAAIVAAVGADALLGDPVRFHPVAGYGQAVGALERRMWRDDRGAGAGYVAVALGTPILAASVLGRISRAGASAGRGASAGALEGALLAAATWASLGGTSLGREGSRMAALLKSDDLPGARAQLSSLCARDPVDLPPAELVRATVESVAENTSDAVVAPLLWAALAGLPGVVGYRALNTLDAMVGYRSARYRRFGWAAARLDDLANALPARLCAAITVVLAPLVGGEPRRAWRVWRRDGAQHPSPNAGQCEAAFAGALDVRLGGRNTYDGDAEVRGTLGDGRSPELPDIGRAVLLSRAVGTASAAALAAALSLAAGMSAGAGVGAAGRRGVRR